MVETMTIAERARDCAAKMGAGDIWDKAIEAIEQALRDQCEECAKIAEAEAEWERSEQKRLGPNPRRTALEEYAALTADHIVANIRAMSAPACLPVALNKRGEL